MGKQWHLTLGYWALGHWALTVVLACGVSSAFADDKPVESPIGKQVADFSLPDHHGNAHSLAELKGKDKSLPGYESTVENLRAGQTVQLTLVAVPRTPAGKKDDPDGLKAADKAKQVRLIVIYKSPE